MYYCIVIYQILWTSSKKLRQIKKKLKIKNMHFFEVMDIGNACLLRH
jgi:hypothetical protein